MVVEKNDSRVELELHSTIVKQGSGDGQKNGRGRKGSTTVVTLRKRSASSEWSSSGRVVSDAWNHFKKIKLNKEVRQFEIIMGQLCKAIILMVLVT